MLGVGMLGGGVGWLAMIIQGKDLTLQLLHF